MRIAQRRIFMKSRILSLLFLMVSAFVVQATETVPVGACQIECPAKSDTYVSINFTRTPVFQGVVASVDKTSSSITVANNPAWSESQFVYLAGSKDRCYVKFLSGSFEGEWFDIQANTADTLTIKVDSSTDLSKISAGDKLQIIPYWTLNTLFPNGANLDKSTNAIVPMSGTTLINKYTEFSDGDILTEKGVNISASFIFYYNAVSGKWAAAGASGNYADTIIEPNAVLKIRQQKDYPVVISLVGALPMTCSVIKIKSSTSHQDYYLAIPSSTQIKLSDLTAVLVDTGIFKPSSVLVTNDLLYLFDNTETGMNRSPTKIYRYRNSGSLLGWNEVGTSTSANDDIIPSDAAIVISKKPHNIDAETLKGSFKPDYIGE